MIEIKNTKFKWFFLFLREFFAAFYFWMLFPFFNSMLIEKINLTFATTVVMIFGLTSVLFTLIVGNLGDVKGNLKAIKIASYYKIVNMFIFTFGLYIQNYYIVGITFALQSFNMSIYNPALNSIIYDLSNDAKEVQQRSTQLYIIFNISVLIAPIIGGFLFKDYLIHLTLISIIFEIILLFSFEYIFKEFKKSTTTKFNLASNVGSYIKVFKTREMLSLGVIIGIVAILNFGFIDHVANIYILTKYKIIHMLNFNLTATNVVGILIFLNGIMVIISGILSSKNADKISNTFIKYLAFSVYLTVSLILIIFNSVYMIPVIIALLATLEALIPGFQSKTIYLLCQKDTQSLYNAVASMYTTLAITISSFLMTITKYYGFRGVGWVYFVLSFIILYMFTKVIKLTKNYKKIN